MHGTLPQTRQNDLEERRLELKDPLDDPKAPQHAGREHWRPRQILVDRLVPRRDDRKERLEEFAPIQDPRKDVKARMQDELRQRSTRGPRSSDRRRGEEGTEVVAPEALLHERKTRLGDGPALARVGKLALTRLEEDVVEDEVDVRVDPGRALRCTEVVGDRLRVDLDASTNGGEGGRGMDEGVEELNERRRFGVDLVGDLDLLEFGEDTSLDTERSDPPTRRSHPRSSSRVLHRERREDLTRLERRPCPTSDFDAKRSSGPRERRDRSQEARLEFERDRATEEREQRRDGAVTLVVVEGCAGDVRVGDDLSKEANERPEERYLLGRHLPQTAFCVRPRFGGTVGEVLGVEGEGTKEGCPGEVVRGRGGVRGVGRGGAFVGREAFERVSRALGTRGERSDHLVVRAHHPQRTTFGTPAEEGGEAACEGSVVGR